MKQCVGCGFCCKKAACPLAYSMGVVNNKGQCKKLIWDPKAERYWCGLVKDFPDRYRTELSIGEGCCCGLNSDRQNIPPPQIPETITVTDNTDWRKAFQELAAAVGRGWISGDVLFFVADDLSKAMDSKELGNLFMYYAEQQRSKFKTNFMG